MKHVFNEIDAAAVRVTSFVQLLVGAAVLLVVVATTGARCRNHHRELLLVLFLLGHFALGLWVGKLFTRKEKKTPLAHSLTAGSYLWYGITTGGLLHTGTIVFSPFSLKNKF